MSDSTLAVIGLALAVVWVGWRIARAVDGHARNTREIANLSASEAGFGLCVTDDTWRGVIEQVIADAVGETVRIRSFLGLGIAPRARGRCWSMRFDGADGRTYVFGSSPDGAPGRRRKPVEIGYATHRFAPGELHAVWDFFAGRMTELPHLAAEPAAWHLALIDDVNPEGTPVEVNPRRPALDASRRLQIAEPFRLPRAHRWWLSVEERASA